MRIWIDTEFNGFQGELISMALVAEDGSQFYEVLIHDELEITGWVQEHVIPFLNKPEEEFADGFIFQYKLEKFLQSFTDEITIIADWPDDIKYFCEWLITDPGYMLSTPVKMNFVLDRSLNGVSAVPHNALEDAIGNMNATLNKEYCNVKKSIE